MGFSTMVVSIIESGAGSVEVSARPALPNTRSTSGNLRSCLSIVCRRRWASATEMPGIVVGMYSKEPSFNGGMNSDPNCM